MLFCHSFSNVLYNVLTKTMKPLTFKLCCYPTKYHECNHFCSAGKTNYLNLDQLELMCTLFSILKIYEQNSHAILLLICPWICTRKSTYASPSDVLSSTMLEKNNIPEKRFSKHKKTIGDDQRWITQSTKYIKHSTLSFLHSVPIWHM